MRVHFDGPRRRRGAWLTGALVLLALVGAVLWGVRSPRAPQATVDPSPRAASPVATPEAVPPATPAPPVAVEIQPAAVPSSARPAAPDERLEVCGRGRMKIDDIERVPGPEHAAARQQMVASLLQGGEREQLLGLLMTAEAAAQDAARREPPECAGPRAGLGRRMGAA